jgi:hypothetical protein
MSLAADGAPVAVKRRAVNRSTKLKQLSVVWKKHVSALPGVMVNRTEASQRAIATDTPTITPFVLSHYHILCIDFCPKAVCIKIFST